MITQAELKANLRYDPETGVFTRIIGQWRCQEGQECGDVKASGYRYIGVCRGRYRAHRLAFLYMTGKMPDEQVDHLDGDRGNNRWANLREATNAENGRNIRLKVNNTSGACGVSWMAIRNKWRARIMVDGREKHIGLYESKAEAIAARDAASAHHGFHPNHGLVRPWYEDAA
jgi:hypothetical protein